MRIKDVAQEAGVSTATVSHVINKTKYVRDGTRDRVLLAIKKFDFQPNAHARTLAHGRSNIIGLLISDITNPFFPELVKSIETTVLEHGYNLMVFNTNYDSQQATECVRRLIQLKVAGVALMTAELEPILIDELINKEVRVVFNDLGMVHEHMSNVILDYAVGIEETVRHLVSLGHERIAHIAGASRIRSGVIRRDAFTDAMRRHLPNVSKPLIIEGDFRFDSGRAAAVQILEAKKIPTAIIAANDMMALGAMQELKEAGLKIPQDISLIGFDDIAFATLSEPPLTTIHSPRTEMGRRAIEALVATIERPHQSGIEVNIPTYLVKRKSTAPPGQTKKIGSRILN